MKCKILLVENHDLRICESRANDRRPSLFTTMEISVIPEIVHTVFMVNNQFDYLVVGSRHCTKKVVIHKDNWRDILQLLFIYCLLVINRRLLEKWHLKRKNVQSFFTTFLPSLSYETYLSFFASLSLIRYPKTLYKTNPIQNSNRILGSKSGSKTLKRFIDAQCWLNT